MLYEALEQCTNEACWMFYTQPFQVSGTALAYLIWQTTSCCTDTPSSIARIMLAAVRNHKEKISWYRLWPEDIQGRWVARGEDCVSNKEEKVDRGSRGSGIEMHPILNSSRLVRGEHWVRNSCRWGCCEVVAGVVKAWGEG